MRFPVNAIYDACVLYPAPLRDLLIRLAQADLVRAHWTKQIHDEWMRNVLRDNPAIAPNRLERTRTLMDAAVRDCLVTGYEELIETVTLPDPDDRHVLAAAIRAGADVIVTFNLGDFPTEILAPHGVEAQHPDEFVTHMLDMAPDMVVATAKRQRESLKNPPKSVAEFLDTLEQQGLVQTVARLRPFAELI